jgi:hypothetical protein
MTALRGARGARRLLAYASEVAVEQQRELGAFFGKDDAGAHDTAPGPCIECPNAARCVDGLACEQFALFSRFGGNERWRAAARQLVEGDLCAAIWLIGRGKRWRSGCSGRRPRSSRREFPRMGSGRLLD